MSFRIALQQYLASMRERDELDVLLPELLMGMDHTVLTRPQRGTRQAGVDCLSEVLTPSGLEAYLFTIKQGDVTRSEFYATPQGIAASVKEIQVDYIRTRLPKHLEGAPKHIVLVSNGRVREEVAQGFASLTKEVAERADCDLSFWGEDKLAQLIEDHLLHDGLILGEGRSRLRKAIATIDEPNIAFRHMVEFLRGVLVRQPEVTPPTLKEFLKLCSAATIGCSVFDAWCRSENNGKPACLAWEHILLAMWSAARRAGLHADQTFWQRYALVIQLFMQALISHFEKVLPQLMHVRALRRYRPNRMAYTNLVFEEMSRLATLVLLLLSTDQRDGAVEFANVLGRFMEAHEGCLLPYFDGQSIDLSVALAAFIAAAMQQPPAAFSEGVAGRFLSALARNKWLPIDSDSPDDALTVELNDAEDPREFFEVTTLVPVLATVAAVLGDERLLGRVRDQLVPRMQGVTLERWFPKNALETMWAADLANGEIGVSRSIEKLEASAAAEVAAAENTPVGASGADEFECVRLGFPWLLALSARHFRHPLPPWFFRLCRGS